MTEARQAAPHTGRWRKITLWVIAALLGIPLALALFVSTTESGLRWAINTAQSFMGDTLQVEQVSGRLIGPLQVTGILFRHAGGEVALGKLELDWKPRRLFFNHVDIQVLRLADVRIVNAGVAREPEPASGEFVLDVQLPGDITVASASLTGLQYQDDTQQHTIDRILLSAHTSDNRVHVTQLQVDAAGSTAQASGVVALTPRDQTRLVLDWKLDLPENDKLLSSGTVNISGRPDAYLLDARIAVQSIQIPAGDWQITSAGNLQGLTLKSLQGKTLGGSVNASGEIHWQPELRWDLAVELAGLDPGKHWSEWPGQLSARLSSNGRYADQQPDLSAKITTLNGQLRGHRFEIDADVALQDSATRVLLNWTLDPGAVNGLASRGKMNIDGTLETYRFNGELFVASPQIPAGNWHLAGIGSQQGLTLETLHGEVLDGAVDGHGTIDWKPQPGWDLALDTRHVDPGQHWSEWPGKLSGGVRSAGHIVDGKTRLNAVLSGLQGTLRGYAIQGQADVDVQDDDVTVHTLELQSGDNRLTASGRIAEQLQLDWRLAANDLAAVMPDWRGAANLSGQLFGSRAQPGVKAQITVKGLSGPPLELEALSGNINLQHAENAQQTITLQASDLLLQGRRFASSTLDVSGTLQQHRIAVRTETGNQSANLTANGGWQQPLWQGTLSAMQWDTLVSGAWSLEQPVAVTLGKTRIQLPDSCWTSAQSRLCLSVEGDPTRNWRTDTRLQQLPVAFFNRFMDKPLQWDSTVNASLQASGSGGTLSSARLEAGISGGMLTYDAPTRHVQEQIKGIDLTASLASDGVDATLHLGLAGEDTIDATLKLPGYQPQTSPWQQQPLALGVRGRLRELALLQLLLEDVATFTGHIDIDMSGSGTLGKPRLAGDTRIQNGSLAVNALGIELRELQLAIDSQDDALNLRGSALSGKGHLSINGGLTFEDITRWKAEIEMQGEDFEVIHTPEAVARISPDLRLGIAPPEIRLNGKLHVPGARFRPKQLPRGVTVSKDVIVVEPEQPTAPPERWKIYSQLNLSLGDDVRLDGFGVKGHLTGSIDLHDEPGRVTTARGKLAIEKATYTVYGRELDIVKGRLLYSGGPVDNPGLDFDAERVVEDVHAGVRARGTLKEPELSLYSNPSLSDADIVSYITLGRPAAQAGQSGTSPTDALAMATGGYLAENIGESLGLEEIKLESGGALEEASLVMGTYLSPQLYVRYSAGLYETASRFEAIYELNKNWSVRTQAGSEESSADVVFSFER